MRKAFFSSLVLLFISSGGALAADAKSVVLLLNAMYGNVCTASLEGWFSKTLKGRFDVANK